MHFGAIDDGSNAGLPEILSPAVNNSGCVTNPLQDEVGDWSVGVYTGTLECMGYGVVSVQTDPDTAILEVKDERGELKLHYELTPQPIRPLFHISDFEVWYDNLNQNLVARVTVVLTNGEPLADANVKLGWYPPDDSTITEEKLTAPDGMVTFYFAPSWSGTYKVSVWKVEREGYIHNPADDTERVITIPYYGLFFPILQKEAPSYPE